MWLMKKNFYQWNIVCLAVIIVIILCYYYVDRQVVYFFHSLNTRQYKLLDYIAEIPAVLILLLPIVLVYLMIRFSFFKHSAADKVISLLVAASGIGFTLREILKAIFGRYWTATFNNNNASLLTHNVYGFNWFQFNGANKSFPSGHMIGITVVAVIISMLYPKYRYLCFIAIMLVGLCQIILYFHFVSDVIAGVFIGALVGYYSVKMQTNIKQ